MNDYLALKTLNQYRNRDVFAYLSLRYYLDNTSCKSDKWISEVPSHNTFYNNDSSYYKIFHYKELDANFKVNYRTLHIPTPNMALAETYLLSELSQYSEFNSLSCVYSYKFSKSNDTSGTFEPYFIGLQRRHEDISKACKNNLEKSILFTDIKKFYPSIKFSKIEAFWDKYKDEQLIPSKLFNLGKCILESYKNTAKNEEKSILTGPMFSHFIANIMLHEIDIKMVNISKNNYIRYVDDITLIGTNDELIEWKAILKDLLNELGLVLHDNEKDFTIKCKDWIIAEDDFSDSLSKDWMVLVGSIKQYLVSYPNSKDYLVRELLNNNIRLPIIDYSIATKDRNYIIKSIENLKIYKWLPNKFKENESKKLVRKAISCKIELLSKLNEYLDINLDDYFTRKRFIPKIKFLLGRLAYLMSDEELEKIADRIKNEKELFLFYIIYKSVSSRNLTQALKFGNNVIFSISQILKNNKDKITIEFNKIKSVDKSVIEQSLAILSFYNIKFTNKYLKEYKDSEIINLSRAKDLKSIMKSEECFIKDFACLHGIETSRHKKTLESAYDLNENLSFDLLNLVHNYSS